MVKQVCRKCGLKREVGATIRNLDMSIKGYECRTCVGLPAYRKHKKGATSLKVVV